MKGLTSFVDTTAKSFALQTKPVDKYIVDLLMTHFKSLERSSQRLIKTEIACSLGNMTDRTE